MRTMWFLAGAGATVYAAVKARRAAEALTPEGLADRMAGLAVGWQLLGDEVRAGMAERESELRSRLALSVDEAPRLEAAPDLQEQTPAGGRHRRMIEGAEQQ